MNPRSLTFRLVAWYCGLLLLVGGFFAAYAYIRFTYYLHNTIRDTLATRADDIASLVRPLLSDPLKLGPSIEGRFAPEGHDRLIRIVFDGHVVYTSRRPADQTFDPRTITADPSAEGRLQNVGGLWFYSREYRLPGHHTLDVETGQLAVTMTIARRGLADTLVIALPLLLGVAVLGGHRLVRRALTPVADMINAAEALTFNSPHKRLPPTGTHDLLDELGRTLNRMLERLDHAYQHASRFSADAAHEMRTPLAIMRGELEFVATHLDLAPEVHTSVSNALDETIRLSQIVESLMALARIEGIGGKRAHWAVDLRALSTETIEQMRLLADEKKIELACTDGPPVFTLGDRDRLKQVLVNLIDNAIKYTRSGGRVVVDVLHDGKHALLEVVDTGIGIAPEHHANIFERFFRVDPDRGARGAGLGLAIIKSICVAHGGSITVASVPDRGSAFRVSLPLAPAHSPAAPVAPPAARVAS